MDAASPKVIRPQAGPQERFLASPADIAIYGGAAGGGKTFGLLLEPVRHSGNPNFGGTIFRRSTVQVRNEGGLWDESEKLYPLLGATPVQHTLDWTFPSGAGIGFAHLEHFADRHLRGEWFDVTATEAAMVVELYGRQEIEKSQARPRKAESFLDGLDTRHSISAYGPSAVSYYRARCIEVGRTKEVEAMNRSILDTTGLAGLEVFKAVALRRENLLHVFHRDPASYRRADAKLAEAVNALAKWFYETRKPTLYPTANDKVDRSVGKAA